MSYREKYLKYKNKYIMLKNGKNIIGGDEEIILSLRDAPEEIILTLSDVPDEMKKKVPEINDVYIDNNGIIGTFTGIVNESGYIYIQGVYDYDGVIRPIGVQRKKGVAGFTDYGKLWTCVSNRSVYNDFMYNEWKWENINFLNKEIIISKGLEKQGVPGINDVMVGINSKNPIEYRMYDKPLGSLFLAQFNGKISNSPKFGENTVYSHDKGNAISVNSPRIWVAVENNSNYNYLRNGKILKIQALQVLLSHIEDIGTESININEDYVSKLNLIPEYNKYIAETKRMRIILESLIVSGDLGDSKLNKFATYRYKNILKDYREKNPIIDNFLLRKEAIDNMHECYNILDPIIDNPSISINDTIISTNKPVIDKLYGNYILLQMHMANAELVFINDSIEKKYNRTMDMFRQ